MLARFKRALVLLSALVLVLGGMISETALPAEADSAPPVPGYLQASGTDTLTPVLSGVVEDPADTALDGRIFLANSSGTAIGGTPTAIGTVFSGERVIYHVPAGALTDGSTYQWYMEACTQGTSTCSAPTGKQTFTVNSSAAPAPPVGSASATITGSSVLGSDAITDPGACSGTDCSLSSSSALKVGGDGTNHWASALKFNMSAIPANAIITSATLNLSESGCLGSCSSGPWTGLLDIYPADTDVATVSTGPGLVAAADSATAASGTGNAGTYDVTSTVQAWLDGSAPNDGLVLEANNNATATSGASYYSPQAGSSTAPALAVSYAAPTVPGQPTNVTVRVGDGGAEVSWQPPANAGDSAGITGYTVTASVSYPFQVLGTNANEGTWAVLTGLTNGTDYVVNVRATNAEGTGFPSPGIDVTPEPVSGTATYIEAVKEFLAARTSMDDGGAATASAASNGRPEASAIVGQLTAEQSTDAGFASAMSAQDTLWTSVTDSNSGALVVPGGSGSVSVYTTESLGATTETGVALPSQDSFATSSLTDYRFTINGGASAPKIADYVNADAAMTYITEAADDSASSTSLNDNSGTVLPSGYQVPAGTNLNSGADTAANTKVNLSGVADWAYNNARSTNDNGFHPDCTDFASRSLHFGGGDPETYETSITNPPPTNHRDDHLWYGRWHSQYSSFSWGAASHLADHLNLIGSYWIKHWNNAQRGDILFAHLGGSSFTGIDHTGVTTKMSNGMPFFSQHTPNQRNYPLQYWISHSRPGTTIWIAVPSTH